MAEYSPLVTVPDDAELDTSQGAGFGLEPADADTLEWERLMIQTVLEMGEEGKGLEMGGEEGLEIGMGEDEVLELGLRGEQGDLEILISAGRSYGDISADAVSSDLVLLFGGEDMTANTNIKFDPDVIFRLPNDVCLHSADAWQSQFC